MEHTKNKTQNKRRPSLEAGGCFPLLLLLRVADAEAEAMGTRQCQQLRMLGMVPGWLIGREKRGWCVMHIALATCCLLFVVCCLLLVAGAAVLVNE